MKQVRSRGTKIWMTTDFLSEISPIMRQKNNFLKLLQVSQKSQLRILYPEKLLFKV